MSFMNNFNKVIRQNVREYGMFIALFIITIFFTITTDGVFISSANISTLLNQTGYIAVLAVGMTLIIVIRHIDLSVGFLSGFIGAITGVMLSTWELPVYITIPVALFVGILAGCITGFMVAQLKIPAFVASLAGFLIYRGAIQVVLSGTGTIIISNDIFNAIGNGFIPDLLPGILMATKGNEQGLHKLTLLIGIIFIIFYIFSEIKSRRVKQSYNFEVLTLDVFFVKLIFVCSLIAYFCWVMAQDKGISWTVVIVFIVVIVYHFITNKTVLGRHIYALGGNPEAAELSGISIKKITYVVFGSMGFLAALSGILYASRLQSADLKAGTLGELNAIAAAFVGGVSAAGGVGKVAGSIIGALVMMSLNSGMQLMGVDSSYQDIVRGLVLAIAVIFDVATRNRGK